MYGAVLDLEVCDDSAERVEHRVENQCLERGLRISLRSRNLLHDGIQKRSHSQSCSGGHLIYVLRLAAEKFADLVGHDFRTGSIHVNLIQDRDNLQSMLDGLVKIGNGLSLNTL